MSDRLFADCCYGTEWQHGEHDPCPQDVVAVPRKPTLEMIDAAAPFFMSYAHGTSGREAARDAYRAMIAAAPEGIDCTTTATHQSTQDQS